MDMLLKINILHGTYKEEIPRRNLRDLSNCVHLPNCYLLKKCGINQFVFHQIIRILEPVVPKNQRSHGFPLPLKIFVTLTFLSTGYHQKSVGKDFNINISQKSVSRIIKTIIEGLNMVLNEWVTFPSSLIQRKQVTERFYRKYHFPDTIGCINGTYIEITCPRDDEEAFFDKNGKYSIYAQIICDADQKIIAICSRFGGAASGAFIWKRMNICSFIEDKSRQGETGWLIGDNKYPQRAWLMTPILHASQGTPESQYNHFHGRTRTCIDKCISKLKGRWHCLHNKPLNYTPHRAAKIINACAVLHNLCISADLPDPELYFEPEFITITNDLDMQNDNINDLYIGTEERRHLAEKIYYNV